jgi:hypothetical protein
MKYWGFWILDLGGSGFAAAGWVFQLVGKMLML